ncbi:beta strand repeat-containing protein [Pectobacterium fontis]|uniref:rhamnogalacturonan endolyase n=2 Tax=Pectobacterium fontis TaxID=2558042 RepID=A0A7V8ILD2_9GAMM|nr:beta strand repeat-containing protein [Pectobacterium fontis]
MLTPLAYATGFGLNQDSHLITVDTGAGLVFTIRRTANDGSSRGAGDIVSLRYRGVEFQNRRKGSQINSGFAGLYDHQNGVQVQAVQIDTDHIRVTVVAGDLTHYYMARRGDAAVYMGTVFAREPNPGLVRYIARINKADLPEGPAPADIGQTTRVVEAHDVFGLPNGQTRSKHYSNMRLKDWRSFGARGSDVGIYMVRDDNEGGSGGPFYRSLLDQGTTIDQELTYIVNYGEVQTEPFRTRILNSYAMVFTSGTAPGPLDTGWFARMALDGYLAPSGRGDVAGVGLTGMQAGVAYTVGFANASAQYWTDVAPGSGRFTRAGMRPGHYRMTVYKNELAVASRQVDVQAGQTTTLHTFAIDDDPERDPVVWRIGRWDGAPTELLNGEGMTHMHPSDIRMAPWKVGTFVVGQSSDSKDFPAIQWADVNSPLRIRFTLTPAQVRAMTLRIGITIAFASGRPSINVNNWKAPIPAASAQPSSRSLTVGSYRGNNHTFLFPIPATALRAGTNELQISIASGKRGKGFLSPGVAYDALDLQNTANSPARR